MGTHLERWVRTGGGIGFVCHGFIALSLGVFLQHYVRPQPFPAEDHTEAGTAPSSSSKRLCTHLCKIENFAGPCRQSLCVSVVYNHVSRLRIVRSFLAWSSRTPRLSTASSERLESCSSARLYVLALLLSFACRHGVLVGTRRIIIQEERSLSRPHVCSLCPRLPLVVSRYESHKKMLCSTQNTARGIHPSSIDTVHPGPIP